MSMTTVVDDYYFYYEGNEWIFFGQKLKHVPNFFYQTKLDNYILYIHKCESNYYWSWKLYGEKKFTFNRWIESGFGFKIETFAQ